ncbi:BTB/POZ domain-containing protein 9-like [Zophobas morio]|uniref:BTB/POZ domain-containing protein 9-like n=1 Tax=Zophobas morio TaxID=2755281 RepID=UPI003083DD8E
MVKSDETVTITDTTKLLGDVASLYQNQKFSDITLLVDDKKLYAHKVILAVRSKYFESLFYEDSQNINQAEMAITGVTFDALSSLLKYIYTGTITIPSDVDSSLQILGLAHQYSFTDLQTTITKKLKLLLNLKNICAVLNTANLYDSEELLEACHSFMDLNASEIVASDCFTDLSQKSMIKLLERSTFFAPEIEIFKNVAKWCKINNDVDDLVIQCVRLSWMTVEDIVSTVWRSKIFDCEKLLEAIAEIIGFKEKSSNARGFYVVDENVATLQRNGQMISGGGTYNLLSGPGSIEYDYHASHHINGRDALVVKLGKPSYFNHIKMRFWDTDLRNYSYYIAVSLDGKTWRKVIDYSHISCYSHQVLFFEQQVAQYIKIEGTHNSVNAWFHLLLFETYLKTTVPKFSNGIICPDKNVATPKVARVISGENPSVLLNGDFRNYDESAGFTHHEIGSGNITIQLAQPYLISRMKLLLWGKDERTYRYFIETSLNKTNWELAVDRRHEDCNSWQNLVFKERAMVFIRITGTGNSAKDGFRVVHFECPPEE